MADTISRRSWIASAIAAAGGLALANAPENWQPAFLTAPENQALLVIGERIIPGSTAAQTNRVIDLVLNIESSATQAGFRSALKAFTGVNFQQLTTGRQDALLTRASNPGDPLHHSFQYLKEWLADAYWTSRPGLKELGFDGQLAWPEFNPCPHPGRSAG